MSFYVGDRDYVQNIIGILGWMNSLKWKYIEEFRNQPYQDWITGGKISGKSKRVKNLTFSVCYGAGHSAIWDQPAWALDMFNDLIYS